jgi:uncharacterized repeat protein (TIGR01451 family)
MKGIRFGVAARRAVALLLLTLLPASAVWAVCVCGFADGFFTTHTGVVIDGNLADWAVIHADPDNNTCDGPSGGLPDRDAPVQSTGRDLTHFAFTWDDAQLYIFTERAGSSSNVQRFLYYADTSNDGLMQTGERVIGVNWQGNTGLVRVYLFQYVSVAPGGDPMVDGMGFGDGYTLLGGFQNIPQQNNPTRQGTWGSPTQLQMEFPVTWAELGLAPGTPFSFHVSSANTYFNASGFPSKIDDNLGGCGGGPGSTQFAALTFVPDANVAGARGATVYAAHSLTNDGNGDDVFDLTSVVSGDHNPAVSYYLDADGSGTLTPGDTLLVDTDGDSTPDTGTLTAGATLDLLIEYQIEDNGPGDPTGIASVVTTATSSARTLVSAAVTDTVTVLIVPDLLVMKSLLTTSDPINGTTDPKAIPGAVVLYTVVVTNGGDGAVDLDTVSVTDPLPLLVDLFVGDLAAPGSGPVQFVDGPVSSALTYTFGGLGDGGDDAEFSDDGGVSFTYTPVPDAAGYDPDVTHIRVNPKGTFPGATLAGSPSFSMAFRVRVQ